MTTNTLTVVHAYHQAWTTKAFDEAIDLLSPALRVEVPINDYPTTKSFAEALVRFGGQVASVDVLSEMSAGNEAMILYDMDVEGLGPMRIVEHFTVVDEKIVRLRQVHDTATLRAAAFDHSTAADRSGGHQGFAKEFSVLAECRRVFDALTTLDGLVGWWASTAKGAAASAGETFELGFAGVGEKIDMRVDAAIWPTSVVWTCLSHSGLPEWEDTKIVFKLKDDDDATSVAFRHVGLVPDLECYEHCHAGWEHFLASLRSYSERGEGSPFDGSRR